MKSFFSFFLILGLFFVLGPMAHARKPAVEPVMGISIDKENEEAKASGKNSQVGYDFRNERSPQSVEPPVLESQAQQLTPYFFTGLMLLLPALIWFGIMRNIKISHSEEEHVQKKDEKETTEEHRKAS